MLRLVFMTNTIGHFPFDYNIHRFCFLRGVAIIVLQILL